MGGFINVDDGEEATVKVREKREKKRAWGLTSKMLVSIVLTALIIAALVIVYVMTKPGPAFDPAYTVVKFDNKGTFGIWITKAIIVNNPENQSDISGTVYGCNDRSSHSFESGFSIIDFDELDCINRIDEFEDDEALYKYKAIILLENWDANSSSTYPDTVGVIPEKPFRSITKIKSQSKIPILSIPRKDKKYFNDGLQIADSKVHYSLDISFKSLDELLEINSHASSPLFEVDCSFNKGKGCLHYFSEPPKNGEHFMGCSGEPKKRAVMDIKCKSYNKDCPELQSWEKTLPSKEYEMCAIKEGSLDKNNIYPPLTCRQESNNTWDLGPGNELSEVSCMDEAINGRAWFESGPKICTKDQNFQRNHPNCEQHEGVTCREWGKWSTFPQCSNYDIEFRKTRYRFCIDIESTVKSNEKCLILEMEIWHGRDACNKKAICT